MTPAAGTRRRVGSMAVRAAIALGAIAILYVVVTFAQVWWASRHDQARPVDAIIVLGAAQYDGTPSPVLQARLDHALVLYENGHAADVIVTGGRQEGDRFTEAYSGFDYLRLNGVPEENIHLEVDGADTYQQLSASTLIMEDNGWTSALLVSDPYHSKRLLGISDEVGLASDVYVSPADTASSPASLTRETAAVSLGRILSYRRVSNWL